MWKKVIKCSQREMTILSRILMGMFCFAPFAGAFADGPLATTAGSNLTAFNPSNSYNNQWATMSNGRDNSAPVAKADFGNCNALISRCATPKCANGGCSDMNVAGAIVMGCVQSNKTCAQYGNELISYMAAQLVANSTAKINAQNAQIAQQQSMESQQQMQQMQQQMYQMQQQMAQQNAESQRQLQEALAQQQAQMAAQQAAALEQVSAAATAAAQKTESGITAYQEAAISRGASDEVLMRKQITGQIITEIEDAMQSLKDVKNAMNLSFEYAGCDSRGNDCTGPKRVAAWREKALGFIDPYDNAVDKIYYALTTAQMVGADISEIYMMLTDSCNQWAEYMCERGATVIYPENGVPLSCPSSTDLNSQIELCKTTQCNGTPTSSYAVDANGNQTQELLKWVSYDEDCVERCRKSVGCKPCRFLRPIKDGEEIYAKWTDQESLKDNNDTVVACGSTALARNKLLGRVEKRQKGQGVIDVNSLELWLGAKESNNPRRDNDNNFNKDTKDRCYIATQGNKDILSILHTKALNKSLPMRELCVTDQGNIQKTDPEECEYINPVYAICDAHVYNIGESQNSKDSDTRATMKEMVALKTTVISQQMYKQYEYLNATLRRLRTQLEKSVLMANLEAAGAKSDSDSSSSRSRDKSVYLNGATDCSGIIDFDRFVDCVQPNVSLIITYADSDAKKACQQLESTLGSVNSRLEAEAVKGKWTKCETYVGADPKSCVKKDKQTIKDCANEMVSRLSSAKRQMKNESTSFRGLMGLNDEN